MITTAYKIYDPLTGEFSCGTESNKWSKFGKTWNTVGHLHQHFRAISHREFERRYLIPGCLLVALVGSTKEGLHAVSSYPRKLTFSDR